MMLLLLLLLQTSVGSAENKNADVAEYERLSDEMLKMSKNNVWKGVDKRFGEMEELDVDISFDHYVLGAQAAQEVGDIATCKKRLAKAIEIKKKKQVIHWYQDIDEHYGYVALFTSSKGGRYLHSESAIGGPVEAQSIGFATQQILEEGEFEGLLPVGSYDFAGQKFNVTSGVAVHLEISPRIRKKTNAVYKTVNE